MSVNLNRYTITDGVMVPDENGEWCSAEQAMDIMSTAAATVYSQVMAATEYANATNKVVTQVKSYLESVWEMG